MNFRSKAFFVYKSFANRRNRNNHNRQYHDHIFNIFEDGNRFGRLQRLPPLNNNFLEAQLKLNVLNSWKSSLPFLRYSIFSYFKTPNQFQKWLRYDDYEHTR